ncbi:ABC transporter permease [Gorillibacterium timonense]|uniref:ABC transporter permease n=1 Tax=Gorillibacterium timonense TaxID=1689269 RepID=UPI00071CA3D9|nr:ABC transporter permease subunit [Gorillibacterium timonense]
MLRLMKCEWQRMMARTKTKTVLVLYLLALAFECLFLKSMGVAMYDQIRSTPMNALNVAPFLLRELSLFLNFILIPMLAADSFNGEYTSGALRMTLLRPVSHLRLITAKWLVQGLLLGGLTAITFMVGTLFGRMALPEADTTSFLGTSAFGPGGALAYSALFYLIAYLVFLAVLGLAALISTVMPHPILAYAGTVCVLIGALYLSDSFAFLMSSSDAIFRLLGGLAGSGMLWISAACVMIAYGGVLLVWRRRDWTH